MNRLIHLRKLTLPFVIAVALLVVRTAPNAVAVVPPPDGAYPNLTTAEGQNALFSLGAGQGNTAIGADVLFSDTTGSWNTGVGAVALGFNNGDFNTAMGVAALLLNTTGASNTAIGTAAMVHNDMSSENTANGAFALFSHVSGNSNTAIGANALFNDVSGQLNTAIGDRALFTVNNGFNGSFNTAVGTSALTNNMSGDNTGVGSTALGNNTTGHDNTAVGVSTLANNDSGSNNVALGAFAGQSVSTANHVICINDRGSNTDNSCYIGSIFGQTNNAGSAVFIDANNKLGTMTSSKRFKEDIQRIGTASEALFALEPVKFHYKKEIDPAGKSQFGLVAEEVEKVNPDLVVRDKEGKPYSVRYDQVNAMLLNEFLKEHQAVLRQQKEIDALEAELKAQRALIQAVNDKVELRKPAPQTVANNRQEREKRSVLTIDTK